MKETKGFKKQVDRKVFVGKVPFEGLVKDLLQVPVAEGKKQRGGKKPGKTKLKTNPKL